MTNMPFKSLALAASSFVLLGISPASAGADAIRAEAYFNAISGGNADTISSFYADDAEFHWVGGPLAGVYKGRDKIKGVWEKFSKAAGDLDHEVLQLSESANGKTSTVTARVKFKGQGEVPVKFVMVYKEGKIASEVWQVDRNGATYAKEDGKPGEPKADAGPAPKAAASPAPKPQQQADAGPAPKAEPKAAPKAEPKPAPAAAQAPGPVTQTAAVVSPAPANAQPPAEPEDEPELAEGPEQEGADAGGPDAPKPDYAPKDAKSLQAEPVPAPEAPVKKADIPPAPKGEPKDKGFDKKKAYGDKFDGGYEKKVAKKKRYYDYGDGYGGYGGYGHGYGYRGHGYGHGGHGYGYGGYGRGHY